MILKEKIQVPFWIKDKEEYLKEKEERRKQMTPVALYIRCKDYSDVYRSIDKIEEYSEKDWKDKERYLRNTKLLRKGWQRQMGYSTTTNMEDIEQDISIDLLVEELPTLRAKIGLSQSEVGEIIGVSRQTYSAIETKKKK